jgi:mitogen-activated protein kinase kinase 1
MIAEQILHGLASMHHMFHQLHLDLKPENLLVKSPLQVKISDLGISAILEHTNQNIKNTNGTFRYMSPERLRTAEYSYVADIWSFGVIIYEMMLTHYPFRSYTSYIDLMQFLSDSIEVVPDNIHHYSSKMIHFLKKCLQIDPAKRPSSIELLADPWFIGDDA